MTGRNAEVREPWMDQLETLRTAVLERDRPNREAEVAAARAAIIGLTLAEQEAVFGEAVRAFHGGHQPSAASLSAGEWSAYNAGRNADMNVRQMLGWDLTNRYQQEGKGSVTETAALERMTELENRVLDEFLGIVATDAGIADPAD